MLIAYHGKPEIKAEYLARVQAHREADEIVKGKYWSGGKGCAVGCTIHGSSHARYEKELGIPQVLAQLEDGIFENIPNELAMTWPERFLSAIEVGADLLMVGSRFLHWLLVDPIDGIIQFASEKGKPVIQAVADLYQRQIDGETIDIADWKKVRASAAASSAAASAAAYSASAAAAAAYSAAASAASAAASAAASSVAAYSAAAYSAAGAYSAAASAAAAYSAADSASAAAAYSARVRQSEKLLELLASAPLGV